MRPSLRPRAQTVLDLLQAKVLEASSFRGEINLWFPVRKAWWLVFLTKNSLYRPQLRSIDSALLAISYADRLF